MFLMPVCSNMRSEPSETHPVRDSVALLVGEHGIEGAERELQRRFCERGDHERALAGLAVLRKEWLSDGE
jgi:hypothetical protein